MIESDVLQEDAIMISALPARRPTSLNAVVPHVGTGLGGIRATLVGTRRRW